jgi:hypothetical protein
VHVVELEQALGCDGVGADTVRGHGYRSTGKLCARPVLVGIQSGLFLLGVRVVDLGLERASRPEASGGLDKVHVAGNVGRDRVLGCTEDGTVTVVLLVPRKVCVEDGVGGGDIGVEVDPFAIVLDSGDAVFLKERESVVM